MFPRSLSLTVLKESYKKAISEFWYHHEFEIEKQSKKADELKAL